MSVVVVAGVWLLLGVVLCLAAGRGIAGGKATATAPAVATNASPKFAGRAAHEWALDAHDLATAELLTTRPGAIRRVAAR